MFSVYKFSSSPLRQRKDSDPVDLPDIDFQYSDSDSLFNELSELYSYSEIPELQETRETFETQLKARYQTTNWVDLTGPQQRSYINYLLEKCEVVDIKDRLNAVRNFLYLAHGNYIFGIDETDILQYSRANVFLMVEAGVFQAVVELLALEKEIQKPLPETSSKGKITIADNVTLRACLSFLYVVVEVIRREDPLDTESENEVRKSFLQDLGNPISGDDNLAAFLFRMLLNFCNGSMPHYPIRKILLLLWKTILSSLGGMDELVQLKREARAAANLAPTFPEVKPARPLILPTAAYDPRGDGPSKFQGEQSQLPGLISRPLSMISEPESLIDYGDQKGLDFRPKARTKDVENFIETCRSKFGCYEICEVSSDVMETDISALPGPIQEGIQVLREHVYISLSEVQIDKEEEIEKKRAIGTKVFLPERDTPVEFLYKSLLPNLPQYMIAILKVLLAAAPTSKSKNESLNIFIDVIPPDTPTNMMESAQNSVDINRHKEVIVKAISAILLLLLKHFKINHIYQFEFVSQHLVFANCIPLVLKFFNQNVVQYVTLKNNFAALNFPNCVIVPNSGNSSMDMVEGLDPAYCWRNLFSCINLIRILQKLTKWKHSRTVMLVVFRSAPILKRALKVKHPLMQLYVLKLLKVQTKYLGRNWRKTNMKIISAIYRRVRHHLHDDWAYGNDLDAKPWDFQTEEFALKNCVEQFNTNYYDTDSSQPINPFRSELEPIDTNYLSILGESVELTQAWKQTYEHWLEVEVFQHPVDWDKLLESPTGQLDIKPLEI